MSEHCVLFDFSDDQKVWIEPCECCDNTTLVIGGESFLVRLESISADELMELSEQLGKVAAEQMAKGLDDFDPEWN